jgi:gamma-glutamyltranspeptidase
LQPQLVAQVAARAILHGIDLESAQLAPRWTVPAFGPFSEARLLIEPGVHPGTLSDLRHRGHVIDEVPAPNPEWGPVSMIRVDPAGLATAPDPRVDTTSAVVL